MNKIENQSETASSVRQKILSKKQFIGTSQNFSNKTKIKFSLRPPGKKENNFFNQTINGRFACEIYFERAARAQDLCKTKAVRLFLDL